MKELIESLTYRFLETHQTLNRLIPVLDRLASRAEKNSIAIEEQTAVREEMDRQTIFELKQINEKLAILSKDLDDTAKVQLMAAMRGSVSQPPDDGKFVRTINALAKIPPKTLLLIWLLLLTLILITGGKALAIF